ncbi:hypothetical protein IU459_29480 [Nocardia amamiensis]|uniref:Uncharacterized protein n=1 Tax=Nocardia amamiensis TaxID=404578 RepID=A0ABS0CZQ7_9NOCA|nr:hypothetical protein [Nocardia amamiensis]MBF6301640.1 hypothetical protein [Nocardia amamiensis]
MTTSTFQRTPELPAWLWTLPPEILLAVLDADGAQFGPLPSMQDYYWVQLRELALRLVVEAPTGPATGTADFLSRFDSHTLAKLWGGDFDSAVWTGVPGVDQQIYALISGKQPMLPLLLAEFTNRFRHWSAFPEQLRAAVLTAEPDFPIDTLTTEKEN